MNYKELLQTAKSNLTPAYPYLDWYPDSAGEDCDGHFYIFFDENLYVTIKEDLTAEQERKLSKALDSLRPKPKTTEEYLRQHSVLDGMGNMDGEFVPISIAMIAIEKTLEHKLEHKPPSWIKE